MKCDKCGHTDNGSGDWAHVCGPILTEKDYDVVIDTLQKQRDILWKMTNLNADTFNIMDQIRLEQIDQLDKAIIMWEKNKQ
jgi:hypothetical protein